jgi:hypothetical protein
MIGAHSLSAKADAEAEAEAEHRIVMRDAAFDPISAIPAREHMKQESDNPLAYDPPLRRTVQRSITVAEVAERAPAD